MKLRYAPLWYDRFPATRRPAFPRHRSPLDTRVAIIGGGLTGCACASALAAARVPVVLLEAGRIGSGATASAPGLSREDFEASFRDSVAAHGLRAARTMWQAMHRASLDLPATLRRLRIQCGLEPQDLIQVAPSQAADGKDLRREYAARRAAGLEPRWIAPAALARETGLASVGGLRTKGSVLDPYRACLGLARAAEARGAGIFESSEVRQIRAGTAAVEVVTSGGAIRAETVIVATDAPLPDLRALRRHLHPRESYTAVSAPLPPKARKEVGQRTVVLRDRSEPPHFVRWLDDNRVLIAGADRDPVPARLRESARIQRTAQLMYELSLLYPAISGTPAAWGWSAVVADTADGLPYIGTHRNFPRHLFALGLGRHGAAGSWLAARVLLRQVVGEPAKGDDLLGFGRILAGR
jgi:glycine/D-amino acid oxidase-like deaminating enzyme